MTQLKITGGARIGMWNASWPFAQLTVSKNKLELNASIIGNLAFKPQDIISITTYKMMPLIGEGNKINHRVSNYNNKIIFLDIS